jgi:hypothetical protein
MVSSLCPGVRLRAGFVQKAKDGFSVWVYLLSRLVVALWGPTPLRRSSTRKSIGTGTGTWLRFSPPSGALSSAFTTSGWTFLSSARVHPATRARLGQAMDVLERKKRDRSWASSRHSSQCVERHDRSPYGLAVEGVVVWGATSFTPALRSFSETLLALAA